MTDHTVSRRGFLLKSGALGCSLAASPLVTPVTLAAAPTDHRLVVIILRGGMDGLDVVRPVGDPNFAALRPDLAQGAAHGLNNFYALHPALPGLHQLWANGEVSFVHAASTPYRDKRSHFDGQDLLEAGIGQEDRLRDGWLNRALGMIDGRGLETAFAVGNENLLVLSGEATVAQWAPGSDLTLSDAGRQLMARMYRDAPLFDASMTQALDLAERLGSGMVVEEFEDMQSAMMETMEASKGADGSYELAKFTAERLREETRIAAFSIGGWDTHVNQATALNRPLGQLENAILTLRKELGPVWKKTAVVAMTEFGRTAHQNGSGGTDHGTGGLMVLSGGAVKGGQVFGKWPGLDHGDLYQGRDLMPLTDVRAVAGSLLHGMFGIARSDLEETIFPGVDIRDQPGFLL